MPSPNWIDELPSHRCCAEYSIWSADLMRLADDLKRIEEHADLLHFDVADGVFAPSFLMFPDLISAMRELTDLPFHIHLMTHDAILLKQIDEFADAGADLISFHVENGPDTSNAALELLEKRDVEAGMVLCVETPVSEVAPWVDQLRFVTLLGTAIGVKGKGLNEAALGRLGEARELIDARGASGRCVLAADGGIREHTVPNLIQAGAETVVMGSLAFGSADLDSRMKWLHELRGINHV